MNWKSVAGAIIIACVLGVGGTVASHEGRISGISEKLDAVHDDVKIIKEILMKKGLE